MSALKYKNGILPRWADFLSQLLVAYSIVTFTLESEPDLKGQSFFFYSEIIVTILFAIEYAVRVYLARDRVSYVTSFYGVVDLLATAPIILTFGTIDFRFARIIRLMRLLRLLKFIRYSESLDVLIEAVRSIKGELTVFLFFIFGIIYVSSVGIHLFEGEAQPEAFGSITRSMWWSIITLTTVGYGDAYPITAAGKMFTSLILMMGLGIVAIPSGLMASALTRVKTKKVSAEKYTVDIDADIEDSPEVNEAG